MKTCLGSIFILLVYILLAALALTEVTIAQDSNAQPSKIDNLILDKYNLVDDHIRVNKITNDSNTVIYQIFFESASNSWTQAVLTYSINDNVYICYDDIKTEYKAYEKNIDQLQSQDASELEYKPYKPNKKDMCNVNTFLGGVNFGIGLIPIVGSIYGLGSLGIDRYKCENAPMYRWLGEYYTNYDKPDIFIENENIKPLIDYYKHISGDSEDERNDIRQDTLGVSANLLGKFSINGVRFTIPLKIKDRANNAKFRFLMDLPGIIGIDSEGFYFEDNNIISSKTNVSNSLPLVQAFNVTPQNLTIDESVTVGYTVSDIGGPGLRQTELWRKNETCNWQQIKINALSDQKESLSGSFTDSPSVPGKYWYGLHVVDNAGNWNDEKNSNTNGQPSSFETIEVDVMNTQKEVESTTLHSSNDQLKTWEKILTGPFGGGGYSVQQTNDDGYIITGSGRNGVVLIKINENGNETWNKTYDGSDSCSVQQTNDGGYILTGSKDGETLLIKTDENGYEIWHKIFAGSRYEDQGRSVQQTADGGYIITGSTFGDVLKNGTDVSLIKTDKDGNKIWDKSFGGRSTDKGYSVQQTTEGGYIIAGYTLSYNARIISDAYIIKTDENGNKIWEKTIGGSFYDEGRSIQQLAGGDYIIAGSTNSYSSAKFAGSGWDAWLINIDANGNELWNKTFDGLDSGNDEARSVQQTTDGGYIIAGYISYNNGSNGVWLIKTDIEGNKRWERTFDISGKNDPGCSVQQTRDGGYIIVAGYNEIYLIKTDANGNILLPNSRD